MQVFREEKYIKAIPLALVYLLSFLSFSFGGKNAIVCVLLASTFIFTAFFQGELLYLLPIVFVGNDALGTVVAGKISFIWLTAVLIIAEKLRKRESRISISGFGLLIFSLAYVFFLIFVQNTYYSEIIKTAQFPLFVLYVFEEDRMGRVQWNTFWRLFGISCVLVAIHQIVFGGIEYAISSGEVASMRYGIIGTGTGDPNYGGLRLVTGVICVFYTINRRILKWPMVLILLYAMVNTLSLTTLASLILIICTGVFFEPTASKKVRWVAGIAFVVVLVWYLAPLIPKEYLPSGMDALLFRIDERLTFAQTGNFSAASTRRTSLASGQLEYALRRPTFQFLFGMEPTPAPGFTLFAHNTYVDWIIHFGIVGFILLIILIIKRFFGRMRMIPCGKEQICVQQLKVLYLFYLFGLSVYSSELFAIWVLVLLLL